MSWLKARSQRLASDARCERRASSDRHHPTSFRVAPRSTAATLVLGVGAGSAAAPGAWAMRQLVDTLAGPQPDRGEVLVLVALFSGAAIVTGASSYLAGIATTRTRARVRLHCEVAIAARTSAIPGLGYLDDHVRLDCLHRARRGAQEAPPLASDILIELLSSITTVMTFAAALAIAWPWMLAAVVATAVPAALVQRRMMQRAIDAADQATAAFRWADYYSEIQVLAPVRLASCARTRPRRHVGPTPVAP